MSTESKALGRRSTVLASVIGSVLASYAGGALALEWEFDNGTRLNWNTTLSVGSSWRADDPSRALYTHADGAVLGRYTGNIMPGQALPKGNGTAGNWAGGEATLNYDKGDRFSTPLKLISDVEIKKGSFGGLLRIKAWYDQALEDETVRMGNQANSFNGARPPLGPTLPYCFLGAGAAAVANCIPLSSPGNNVWPRGELSDKGFEDEQKFSNVYLLDAYVYGSVPVGDSDLQLRLGNQVINWGESVFIQGVNQINPIDVPAARRAGAELKEILLPVWAAYINWGFNFGSLEAFYQLQWNNTSIDGCGTYWAQTAGLISSDPGPCNAATATGNILGTAAPGTTSPLIAQYGSTPFLQANGLYVPLVKGKDASDSGQFGLAFRFPVDAIDTEIGLYYMNIHSRLPVISSVAGTSPNELTPTEQAVLTGAGIYGTDAVGGYYRSGTTNFRSPLPLHVFIADLAGRQALGQPIVLKSSGSYWEYPEDIQIFGVSAATNLFGWSVSSELSYQQDVPVQVNGNDLLAGGLLLIGPHRADSVEAYYEGTGAYLRGWDRFDKTQFQINTVKTFSNILGAGNMLLIGEVGFQWNDVPDYTKDNVRYGRGFMWGYGSSPGYAASIPPLQGNTCTPTLSGLPVPVASPLYNPSPRGCRNNGYITDYAWGYRIRASADYLNVFGSGVTVTPSIFWAHDVDGISMDPMFIEDRQVLGLGVKFVYNKKYTLDFNWVDYANEGYDPLQDRDYYSAAFSVTF
jgi:hypothetical protein